MKIDVHQHVWTEPLLEALARRDELPFVRQENGLTVLYLAGERPYVIDTPAEDHRSRSALVERDGLDRAFVCLSSPLAIEWLPRAQARGLIDAYHEGALALEDPFGVWAAIALEHPDPRDIDRALARGFVGLALPAGALADVRALGALREVLARLEAHEAPLLVHPGPTRAASVSGIAVQSTIGDPLWWPALTGYVAGMQASWFAFLTAGRLSHPRLRVIFSMLAGLAPLHLERLGARGGPRQPLADPLTFYESSSYGPATTRAFEQIAGAQQLLYGSDRPVIEPHELGMPDAVAWDAVEDCTRRVFAGERTLAVR